MAVAGCAFSGRRLNLNQVCSPNTSGTEVIAAIAAASQAVLTPLPLKPVVAFDPEPEISALHNKVAREAAKAARID